MPQGVLVAMWQCNLKLNTQPSTRNQEYRCSTTDRGPAHCDHLLTKEYLGRPPIDFRTDQDDAAIILNGGVIRQTKLALGVQSGVLGYGSLAKPLELRSLIRM